MTRIVDLETAARKLFMRDNAAIASRDRKDFRNFDNMPPGLQQWWRDRAERYIQIGTYTLTDAGSVT